MNNTYLSANTVVRKISYTNEEELHRAIEDHMIVADTIYKVIQLVPINETSAYLTLTPDTDKMLVHFVCVDEADIEVLPDAPNGDICIMGISEIAMLKDQKSIVIDGESFDIDNVEMSIGKFSERYTEVSIRKSI